MGSRETPVMHDTLSLIASLGGALIAFLATVLVSLLGFMGKFAVTTLSKRVDESNHKIALLETIVVDHSKLLASFTTQTESENQRHEALRSELHEMRTKLDRLGDTISELNSHVLLIQSPKRTTKR